MDLNLRIIHTDGRTPDVDLHTGTLLMSAILHTPLLLQSLGSDGSVLSVHPYLDPVSSDERWALVLARASDELVVADAAAKRHVFKAYRDLVAYGEKGHTSTRATPHAWDYSDVPGMPTNKRP